MREARPFKLPRGLRPNGQSVGSGGRGGGGATGGLPIGKQWLRVHSNPRKRLFDPTGVDGGPGIDNLQSVRTTHMYFASGVTRTHTDEWTGPTAEDSHGTRWAGVTVFTLSSAPTPLLNPATQLDPYAAEPGHPDTAVPPDHAPTFDPARIDRTRPCDGDTPPVPLAGADPGDTFIRTALGVWCKKRGKNLHAVDRCGQHWSKPKLRKPDGSPNYNWRPSEMPTSIWHSHMNQVDPRKYWQARDPPFPSPGAG